MAESKVVVPESVLKKIKRQEEWTLAKKEEAVAAKKKSVETWKLIFKRVEQYAKEYAEKDNELIRLKRESKLKGGFYVDPEAKLLFIIRIRGINAIDPKTKKILQLLRLRQIFNGVFLKVNKATVNMLRRVEPDVTYGYPNLKIVKELIYKRGYRKLNHERIALTDNSIVDQALGKQNGKYAEDAEDDKTKAIFGHRDFSSLKKLSVLQHQVPEPIYDVKQLIIVGRYNGRFSGVMRLEIFVG